MKRGDAQRTGPGERVLEDDLGLARVAPGQVLHVPHDLPQDVFVRLAEVQLPALAAGGRPLYAA